VNINEVYRPGHVEIYAGCMNSGKGAKLMVRADALDHQKNPDTGERGIPYIIVKPVKDNRTANLYSRLFSDEKKCFTISDDKPSELYLLVEKHKPKVVIMDELNFVEDSADGHEIEDVIEDLATNYGIHFIGAGLNTNFRGEPYSRMPQILSRFYVHSLVAVCDVPGCHNIATRTQRLVRGLPALYDEPTDSIEGQNEDEDYQARCLIDHYVPRNQSELEEMVERAARRQEELRSGCSDEMDRELNLQDRIRKF
jgi:thymidine kinase